ncbi:hypothetical protein IFM47457_08669 [Aspergillus lentulus]|nr:hypothetical protein IFM47457_08669 [Aspergillus lentulus]
MQTSHIITSGIFTRRDGESVRYTFHFPGSDGALQLTLYSGLDCFICPFIFIFIYSRLRLHADLNPQRSHRIML